VEYGDEESEVHHDVQDIYDRYEDLLKLANNYRLEHLKELMEVRLSRSVTRLNVRQIKNFAETHNANQLKNYCNEFIRDNDEL
jgi:hypothetical protein